MGLQTTQGRAAGLFGEDVDSVLHDRQKKICTSLGVQFEAIKDDLFPISVVGRKVDLGDGETSLSKLKDLKDVEAFVESQPQLKLLVLDSASVFYSGNENDRRSVAGFLTDLTGLAQRHGIAIVLLAHESKGVRTSDTHAVSGSTAWPNQSRSTLKLNKVNGQSQLRELVHIKTNYGPLIQPISLQVLDNGVLVPLSGDAERDIACYRTITDLTIQTLEEGGRLAPSPNSIYFAPKVLCALQKSEMRFTQTEIKRAIEQLESPDVGLIGIDEFRGKNGSVSRKYCLAKDFEDRLTDENEDDFFSAD